MNKWRNCSIGDFVAAGQADIQTGPFGTQLKASDYVENGIPVINVRNIGYSDLRIEKLEYVTEHTSERLSEHLLREQDIVFGRKGAVDRHLYASNAHCNWMQGSDCIRLRFQTDAIFPRFISYSFLQPAHQQWMLLQSGNKATMASLNHEIIKRIQLRLPTPIVQKEIVRILSAYDDLIENNQRRMTLLEESARLLYREWFVRLRFPGWEHTRVVGGVPEGWEKRQIGDYIDAGQVELQTGPFGTQLKASDYTESGTPVINVRNIGYGDLRADKLEFVSETTTDRLDAHILKCGDIVFGRKGAVDRHLLINGAQAGWMQGSDCIRLRLLSESVCPLFLSIGFREEGHHQWMLTQCSNKATMASLNQEVIARIPLLVPEWRVLREFRDFASDVLRQMEILQRQSVRAASARDHLLPRLMSGEVAV